MQLDVDKLGHENEFNEKYLNYKVVDIIDIYSFFKSHLHPS
jgi:hypothetical protein